LIILATIIIILLKADLIDKKIKSEKMLYIISAITFLPRIIVALVDFYNIILISKTSKEIGINYQTSMKLFTLLMYFSIFIFLITKIFEIRRTRIFLVILFSISCIVYMLLIFLYFSSLGSMITNLFEVIGSTLLLFIVMLIAVVGIMLTNSNVSNPEK
jgi:hypothetical protein